MLYVNQVVKVKPVKVETATKQPTAEAEKREGARKPKKN